MKNVSRFSLVIVKELCVEKSTKTDPVDFEPLLEKGTCNFLPFVAVLPCSSVLFGECYNQC